MWFKRNISIVFILLLSCWCMATNMDSIQRIVNAQVSDSAKVEVLVRNAREMTGYDVDNALKLAQQALDISLQQKLKYQEARSLISMSEVYVTKSDYMSSLEKAMQAQAIYEALGDEEGKGDALHAMGNVYFRQDKSEQGAEYFKQALAIRKKYSDKEAIANTMNNLGIIYTDQKNTALALEYLTGALKNYEALGLKDGIAASANNIGLIYIELNMWPKAMEHFQRTFLMAKQLGNIYGQSIAMTNIGRVYLNADKLDLALSSFKISLKHAEVVKDMAHIRDIYDFIAQVYEKKLDYVQAYQSLRSYVKYNDSLYNNEYAHQMAEMEARYQKERYQKQIELLNKDKEIQNLEKSRVDSEVNRQRIVIWSIVGILIIVLVMGLLAYRNYKEKQKANLLLESAYTQIELKNKLITDSIDSAKTIQETILPSSEMVARSFTEHFIFYQPKDIVSGDFYWLYQNGSSCLLAAADCTGHGIPGAFMTFLGFNLLENAVKINKETDPKNVLTVLDKEMQSILINNASVKGGMDMALVNFNKTTNQLTYSGAKNPVYVVRDKQLHELKPGKGHIGNVSEKQYVFEDQQYQLQKGDMVYLFTDGFADQLGGEKKEKFFYQPFRELLITVSGLDLSEQKQKISQAFNGWKGDREQTDDVLVVGVRV